MSLKGSKPVTLVQVQSRTQRNSVGIGKQKTHEGTKDRDMSRGPSRTE